LTEYLGSIKQAGRNLLSVINDILDISKIESGKLQIIPVAYLFSSLLNDVITIIRFRITEKPLEFIINADSSFPDGLIGDEARVRQILLNILTNAVKYTEKGYVKLTVSASDYSPVRQTINLCFKVEDSGIGIKEEDMGSLFSDFVRLDGERNRGIEGTGLGLAITWKLCKAMGGDISVSSEYGKGSVFTVNIPQYVSGTDTAPLANILNGGKTAEQKKDGIRFTAPEAKILIVDDIKTNLIVAEGLLAPYKTQIECCTSGAEAVRLAGEKAYDLILMDHMMPGMDGIEAVAKIRGQEKSLRKEKSAGSPREIPIIALTANTVTGMKEMFLDNGFNDYIPKPIEVSKLDEIMEIWIPLSKRTIAADDAGAVKREQFRGETELRIPGVDVIKGITMTGGVEAGYLQVLKSFYLDAEERLALLEQELNPPDLTTHVHALKSAFGTIGAAGLSAAAAALEKAGKAEDAVFIRDKLPPFREHLKTIIADIKNALNREKDRAGTAAAKAAGTSPAAGIGPELKALLLQLREALTAKNMKEIDRLIAQMEEQYTGMSDTFSGFSDQVLVGEYKAVIEAIDHLIG
jgi:CheY-like chemotaxis protein